MAAVQTMKQALRVFVGYDSRERAAFEVCVRSMLEHASIPLLISPLEERLLRHAGLYRREWRHHEGQFIDVHDRRPFSTEFAFTRFLVPALCQWDGAAVFCDCDFLWRGDIAELAALADPEFAVQCVQHRHEPAETVKMEGQAQGLYLRKNWSSLVIWNCEHPSNLMLTPHRVNTERGQWLHAFSWLEQDEIGSLPVDWNYLVGTNTAAETLNPKAVHFTMGIPTMPGRAQDEFAGEWRDVAGSITAEA